MLLCGGIPLVSHFMVRAMKGYINVIRFGVISRAAVECTLSSAQDARGSSVDLREKLRLYYQEWRLPISRHHVWSKALAEFSFGYIYAGLAGLIAYDASRVRLTSPIVLVCVPLIATSIFELAVFHWRSPYMRPGPKDKLAIRNR